MSSAVGFSSSRCSASMVLGEMKRMLLVPVTSALVVGVLATCTGAEPKFKTFHAGRSFRNLTFSYPGDWEATRYRLSTSFVTTFAYMSSQPMSPPCSDGISICDPPVSHLEPGGIIAWWSVGSYTDWSFERDAVGQPLIVGGRRARLSIEPGCHAVGGEVFVGAVIGRSDDSHYAFSACIRGPGTEQAVSQVRTLLRSVRFGTR
jgi:hypothetical protein